MNHNLQTNEYCYYCDRVRWGNWQPLGHGRWRHEECYPGSAAWMEFYKRLSNPTTEQRYLYKNQERKVAI